MIYQPRNVQPSGVSIDGLLDNTFTMEIQTNSYVSAYQLLIVDFDNNEIYTGSKTTLANYAYNGDTLEIPVSASTVALSNGTNYKWRVRLYQPTADMLITYGLVQATSTTTTIYLQPNINIKAGMAITINSQTKTISSYNSDTGVAVVSSAFSSAPAVGTQYKIYSDFIETVPDYIVYARRTPAVAISNVPSSLTLKYHTFQGTYIQSDNVPIVYHKFDLYTRNDDGTISLVASSDKVYSANLSYTYDSFRTGNKYLIQMTVENDMGIISTTDMYEFTVSYDIVEYLQQPLASFDDKNNAVKVSWVTPVEHDATSFRSDAATGTIQDNSDTFTQATFEPGQSIGEGDVVQTINSDFDMVLYGRSTQETRSGKNVFDENNLTFTDARNAKIEINNHVITMTTLQDKPSNDLFVIGKIDDSLLVNGESYTISSINVSGMAQNFRLQLRTKNGGYVSGQPAGSTIVYDNTYSLYVINNPFSTSGSTVIPTGTVAVVKDIQVEKGTIATTYEPYGVMPSPDYPSEVECVRGKNLFDKDTMIELVGKFRNWDNGLVTENSSFVGIKVPVEPNSTYSVSSNLPRALYSNLAFFSNDIYLSGSAFTSGSSFITPENCNYITLAVRKTYIWFQIEKGSVATDYVPYNNIQIKNTGKNLFDKDNAIKGLYYDSVGGLSPSVNWYYENIRVKPNTSYSISGNATKNTTAFFVELNKNLELVKIIGNYYNTHNFTTSNETYYVGVSIPWYGDSDGRNNMNTFQIEIGDSTPYEPYKSQTLNIDLQGNELCSIGNVKDELVIKDGRAKIIKRIIKTVFNGSETINAVINNRFQIQLNSLAGDGYNNVISMCDKLVSISQVEQISTTKENVISVNGNYVYIRLTSSTILAELKTWLSNNPVTVYYVLATPEEIQLEKTGDISSLKVDGKNYLTVDTNIDSTFDLVYPYKTITGNTNDYTLFNPAGVSNIGTIKSYNALTGVATLMADRPFTYAPMKGDSYAVISNIYNVSGFSYLYNTPYNTVNSLYTHGYTATWSTPDGLCVLPDDFNITLQFSPDGNFFYDKNGVYQEVVNLITTETDDANNEGEFTIKIDKNKLIFVQNPDISLELPFYTNTTQVFVLSSASIAQINNDYVWDDTATWTDTYTWVEGGTSLERVCNHWWKVQITNTGIKIEEIFPTT